MKVISKKNIIPVFLIVIIYLVSFIGILKADIYFSAGGSKFKNNNLELNMLSKDGPLYSNFSISSTTDYQVGDMSNGDAMQVNTHILKTDTYYFSNNSKAKIILKPEKDSLSSLGYNFSIGYRLFNKIRVEGEYKGVNMGTQTGSLLTKLNIKTYEKKEVTYKDISENTHTSTYFNNSSATLETDLLSIIAKNTNNLQYIKSTSKANYYFLNMLYDVSLGKYLGVFGGAGIGLGKLNIVTQLSDELHNLPLNLSGNSSFKAYQYKIGVYVQPIKYLRFSVGLNQINSIVKVNFNEGRLNKIQQNSVDFLVTVLTNIW